MAKMCTCMENFLQLKAKRVTIEYYSSRSLCENQTECQHVPKTYDIVLR